MDGMDEMDRMDMNGTPDPTPKDPNHSPYRRLSLRARFLASSSARVYSLAA